MIIGISDMRWKANGERSAGDGHSVYYSGSADTHEHGVEFIVNSQAVSCRINTICLKVTPVNVAIV